VAGLTVAVTSRACPRVGWVVGEESVSVVGATGVAGADGAEGTLGPTAFSATTVTVEATPSGSPGIVHPVVATVQVAPLGSAVAVYPVIGLPPVLLGACQVTASSAFPGVTVTPAGAEGAAAGVTAAEGADGAPVPIPFVAVTVTV
jgi:hypothetical protein